MSSSKSSAIGETLWDALSLSDRLRERKETAVQSQIDSDKETRLQDRFERSFVNLGVYPKCRGIRIA